MCQFRDRFDYAYASVWEGNFTNCIFSTGECTRPLEGNDCMVVTCDGAKILCPPACESLATGQCAQLHLLHWRQDPVPARMFGSLALVCPALPP